MAVDVAAQRVALRDWEAACADLRRRTKNRRSALEAAYRARDAYFATFDPALAPRLRDLTRRLRQAVPDTVRSDEELEAYQALAGELAGLLGVGSDPLAAGFVLGPSTGRDGTAWLGSDELAAYLEGHGVGSAQLPTTEEPST